VDVEVAREVGGEGVERSQCRIEPSDPPETKIGCTGCQATAIIVCQWRLVRDRRETHTAHFFLVAFEHAELFHSANVKDAYCLVA
jgi:hypothetical protein